MGLPATDVPKSTPGHGGARPGAGRPPKAGRTPKTEQNDAYTILAKAKAKHETYKAQLAELAYKQAAGELIRVDEAKAVWAEEVQRAKQKLLHLPARVAPTILGMEGLRDVERALRDAIIEALDALSADD